MKCLLQCKRLDSFSLKLIAMTSMILDHIGAILFPEMWGLRIIGRLAFPIYCFLLTEGFVHTHDQSSYLKRLFIFALISEIPYNLAFSDQIFDFGRQNVFFTLFLGLGMLMMLSKCADRIEKGAVVLIVAMIAELLHTDYGYVGILFILCFYLAKEKPLEGNLLACGCNFLGGIWIQFFGILSTIPILMYNGKKGKSVKYLFYIFYPAHLLILAGIAKYITRMG